MVGRDYLLEKPRGPSVAKRFLDIRVVPLAVNAAGWVEGVLDRASVRSGVRPAMILAGSTGALSLLLVRLLRRRRRAGGGVFR